MGGGTCRRNGLELAPLLERHADRSPFHAPLFTAVVHKYPAVVPFLLRRKDGCDLQLTPALSFEHLLLTPDGQELPGADLSGQPNGPSGQVAGPDGQQALPIGAAGRARVCARASAGADGVPVPAHGSGQRWQCRGALRSAGRSRYRLCRRSSALCVVLQLTDDAIVQ